MRIFLRVLFLSQACVAVIVEAAILQVVSQEEVPNVDVVPVEDREDPHELRPARTAFTDGLEITGPWVCASVAHQDRFDLLFVD